MNLNTTIGERLFSKKHYTPSNIINGAAIKKLRLEQQISIEDLAKRTDLTPVNLERIERSDGNTSTGKVRALAHELGVHPAMLITGIEEFIHEVAATAELEPITTVTEKANVPLAYSPDRDVTLLRTFAGEGEAYLQVGTLKTPIPDEILGDILHVIAVYKLRTKM